MTMNSASSTSPPLLSFGLPVRNGGPTIAQAIESVLAQTFEDWELVISDNLSTDGTSDICASYAGQDPRIRHIPTGRDLPLLDNFRAAFWNARGTFFRWHGDDDWLEPEYAEQALAAFDGSPSSVLCTTAQRYYRRGKPLPIYDAIPLLGGVDASDPGVRVRALLRLFQKGGNLGVDPVYSLVRRDVAAMTRLQGSIRDGDFVYSCEVALLGPFAHVPEVLANRRLPDESRGTPLSKTFGGEPPGWRRFVQREVSLLQVAQASRTLPLRSRVRLGGALVAFGAREHAHGLRRRTRRFIPTL